MKLSQESLGETLRERRKSLALKQTDLVQMAGISLHTLVDLETGRGNPTLKVISQVLEVLGLELQVQMHSLENRTGEP